MTTESWSELEESSEDVTEVDDVAVVAERVDGSDLIGLLLFFADCTARDEGAFWLGLIRYGGGKDLVSSIALRVGVEGVDV